MRGSQDQQKCTWYDARLLKHQQYSETIISQHFVVCIGALLFVLIFKNGVIGHGGTNAFSSGYSLKTNHQWDTSTRQIHQLIPCCNTYIYIYYVSNLLYNLHCATTWNAFRFGIIWHTRIYHVSIESLAEVHCARFQLLSHCLAQQSRCLSIWMIWTVKSMWLRVCFAVQKPHVQRPLPLMYKHQAIGCIWLGVFPKVLGSWQWNIQRHVVSTGPRMERTPLVQTNVSLWKVFDLQQIGVSHSFTISQYLLIIKQCNIPSD